MSTVQFDPKITPDFQIDLRRPSSQGADPFADLLKRHFDLDQRPRAPKRAEESAADPVSGRPPRLVITHQRTLRGEAKRIDDGDRALSRPADQAPADTCPAEDEPESLEHGSAAATDASKKEMAAEAPAKDKSEGEQSAPSAVEAEPVAAEPAAAVIIPVQEPSEATADEETTAAAIAPSIPVEDGVQPEGTLPQGNPPEENLTDGSLAEGDLATAALPEPAPQGAATEVPTNNTEPDPAAGQPAVTAMAETALAEGIAALSTGQPVLAEDAAPASPATAATPAVPATPATPAKPGHTLVQAEQLPPSVVGPAVITPARPDRSSMDIKLRASAPARATPATPAQPATPATPAQPSHPHAGALPQPGSADPVGDAGDPFDPSLSEGGSGQGWTLHLAQGAASKRPDFVAQLRQHLQNLPAHEQVAVHLQRAVREGTNKFSIQLSPAELGNIHVKLEIDEEKRVTAAVTVERPSTLELLQRDTKGLERALHNAGLNMEGGDLSFSLGRGDQEFAQDMRQSGASAAGGQLLEAEPDGDQPESPVAQVTDTAAGIVNVQV